MPSISSTRRTVDDIFKDYNGRRTGIVRTLTIDVDEFYALYDPEKENLCLYGHPDGSWEVMLPAEEVPRCRRSCRSRRSGSPPPTPPPPPPVAPSSVPVIDGFYLNQNGWRFYSAEGEVCHILFLVSAEYTECTEIAGAPPAGATELRTCPVCLGEVGSGAVKYI